MDKVFLVGHSDNDGFHVGWAFSTEEKAIAFVNEYNSDKEKWNRVDYEEIELDEGS